MSADLPIVESMLKNSAVTDRRYSACLNRFAWFTALATLLLICSGGMVTSKGVGLAVPDWPTTFGYNMFLFPVSKWIGGVLFEHTHRLIASTVGFLTIILAVWLWRTEDRPAVKTLGLVAVAGVILQGILGGLRVTMLKDLIGIAVIAFCVRVLRKRGEVNALRRLSILWVVLFFLQFMLGAWTIWSNKAADVATTHVAVGAIMLSFGVSSWAICSRVLQTKNG